jgi:hypothetical protein
LKDNFPPSICLVPTLQRGENGDDRLQRRIDVRVAARIVSDASQRFAEMGLDDGGVPVQ